MLRLAERNWLGPFERGAICWRRPAVLRHRSYLSTAAKHGLGLPDALVVLTEGRSWMPVTA
jgi:hypothetical protein